MKKVLLILLALMLVVGGVLFADDPPPVADATLTLKAKPITAVLKHGFVANAIPEPSFATISASLDTPAVDYTYEWIEGVHDSFDLESDAEVPIGYYYFVANNPVSAYKVTFTVNPFTRDSSAVKVPLTLELSAVVASGAAITTTDTIIKTGGAIGSTETPVISSGAKEVLVTSKDAGDAPLPSYAGIGLTASTTGTDNKNYGLPASADNTDIFIATVVASVTTW